MLRSIVAAATVLVLTIGPAQASRRIGALGDHAVITNGTAHRCLFKAEGLLDLGSVAISRAHLTFEVQGEAADRTLYLSVCPVTTEWEAGSVDWTSGWNRPGGDFDEEMAARTAVDLSREGRVASFDVTPILKEWLESGVEYDGFILTVQPRVGEDGIRGEDMIRLQGLTNGSLELDYLRVPPRPVQYSGS